MSIMYPHFEQVQSVRENTQNSFSKGVMNYKWGNNGSSYRWNPSKSFFRIRMKLTASNTANANHANEVPALVDGQPSNINGVAFNMFPCDNLWQKLCLKINDVPVSEQNDYVAQCATLYHRMANKSWMDSVGESTMMSEANILDRMDRTNNNGALLSNSYLTSHDVLTNPDPKTIISTATLAIVADGTATFTAVAQPTLDISKVFKLGDIIIYTAGATRRRAVVTKFVSNLVMVVSGNVDLTAVAAAIGDLAAGLYLEVVRPTNKVIKSNIRETNDFEFIYRPNTGFWKLNNWFPSGDWQMELTPHPNTTFQKYAIESLINKDVGTGDQQFRVEIVSMFLYTFVGVADKVSPDMTFSMSECRMQSQNLTTNTLTQKTFIINPNSYAITLGFQQANAGENTAFSRSKFKLEFDRERDISRFYLRRGSRELPTPYPDPLVVSKSLNPAAPASNLIYLNQLYIENMCYSGNLFQPQETLDEWLERGLFYHYLFDGKQGDERVYISTQFSGSQFVNTPQLLLFDHFLRTCKLEMKDGEIYRVIVSSTN